MKVLISGASGYIGSHLLKNIDHKKYQLAVLVRKNSQDILPGAFIIDSNDADWKTKVRSFNPHVVIHLAAYLTSGDDESQIDKLIESNIRFGTHLLDALKKTDISAFVNTGTFAEYHLKNGKRTPAYLYAATKTAFRSIIEYYQSIIRFKLIDIIPYTVYGGNHSAKKLIDYIYESLRSPDSINMTPGEQVLDFIHIKDVTGFYVALLSRLDQINKDYTEIHLGSGTGTTPKMIASLMEKFSNTKCNINWGGLPYRENDTMFSVAPQNLSGAQIGWYPSLDLEQGIHMFFKEKQGDGI
jgi:CDP-paratose synthetase